MSAVITGVTEGSPAQKSGVRAGETLLYVNGNEVEDVLDYRFFMTEEEVELELLGEDGKRRRVFFRKDEYEDAGLCFETYLMDRKHSCRNHCVFCFIDQLPRGLRPSLYFKDDDDRLSFLMGNYVTLTNLGERELRRITQMHLSPVNISVHTTDPALRVRMMRNPDAGRAYAIMKRFARHRIKMNCQIVLCRGLNDGPALDRTLSDLKALRPAVESVAVVPVGLTKYREGLEPLLPFGREEAEKVLCQVNAFGDRCAEHGGDRFVRCADEFYLLAGRETPPAAFYGAMNQLENGVGLVSLLRDGFDRTVESLPAGSRAARRVSLATGTAAAELLRSCAKKAQKALAGLECFVYPISNKFFGESITVAGLVAGRDLIGQLKGRELGDELLIPAVMLRREGDLFLDGVTLADVEKELKIRVRPVENDGEELLSAMAGGNLPERN